MIRRLNDYISHITSELINHSAQMNLNLFFTWTFRGFAIEIIAKKAQCAWTAALTERPIVRRFNRWPDRHQFSNSCLLTRSAFNAPALGFGLIAELCLQLKLSKSRRMSINPWVGKSVKAWNANCLIATQSSRLHLWDSINLIISLPLPQYSEPYHAMMAMLEWDEDSRFPFLHRTTGLRLEQRVDRSMCDSSCSL